MTRSAVAIGVGCVGVVTALVVTSGLTGSPKLRVAAAAAQSPTTAPAEVAVHNFGSPINSKWDEGELSFADDGTMVFTSSRQDLGAAPGDPKDLYIATFNKASGTWNAPVSMGQPVNAPPATTVDPLRKGDDREPWITPDGNTIYFKSDRLATTTPRNNNDIFVTRKVNGRWTTPDLVPAPISTDAGDEHCPMLLRDGKTLCFASARPGGYGSFDVWCSQQGANGAWQPAVNQGPTINTEGSEFHFMQDRDAKWVYFTSTRPGGQGGADLYAARSLGPNTWGPAVNLGPQVNTVGMDMCPALQPDGKTICWFTSARTADSLGMSDIYRASQSEIDRVLEAGASRAR
jgi:Tol biopolymer transport system component